MGYYLTFNKKKMHAILWQSGWICHLPHSHETKQIQENMWTLYVPYVQQIKFQVFGLSGFNAWHYGKYTVT